MTTKLGRNYTLTFENFGVEPIVIQPPITIELDVTRDIMNSANTCTVRVYNLSLLKRDLIYYEIPNYALSYYKKITLKAGYGDNLSTIFTGNINRAYSVREGVDFITQIESLDGGAGFVNSNFSHSFGGVNDGNPIFKTNTTYQTIIRTMLGAIASIRFGGIGNFPGAPIRRTAFSGTPSALLYELTNRGFFIDNGRSYAMNNNEFIPTNGLSVDPAMTVDASTGLLNTPVFEGNLLGFEMLFEPSLSPGMKIEVISKTFPKASGPYRVNRVHHQGMISPSVCGELITRASCHKCPPDFKPISIDVNP